VAELDRELADIISFTLRKEAEFVGQLEALELEVHSLEKQHLVGWVLHSLGVA